MLHLVRARISDHTISSVLSTNHTDRSSLSQTRTHTHTYTNTHIDKAVQTSSAEIVIHCHYYPFQMDPSDPDFKYLGVDRKALLKEQGNIDVKNVIWVEDEKEGYVLADIVETTGDTITVKLKDASVSLLFSTLSYGVVRC